MKTGIFVIAEFEAKLVSPFFFIAADSIAFIPHIFPPLFISHISILLSRHLAFE